MQFETDQTTADILTYHKSSVKLFQEYSKKVSVEEFVAIEAPRIKN